MYFDPTKEEGIILWIFVWPVTVNDHIFVDHCTGSSDFALCL